MSKETTVSPAVQALKNQVEELKEKIEKLSAYPEMLENEKHIRKHTEEALEIALAMLERIKKWASEFERFSDSQYSGSYIFEEVKKLTQEKKTDSDDKL